MTDRFISSSALLKRRHAAEIRFQWSGRIAIFIALGFLAMMIFSIASKGIGALTQTYIALNVDLGPEVVAKDKITTLRFGSIVKSALKTTFPKVRKRRDRRKLYGLVSADAEFELKRQISSDPNLIGGTARIWFIASDDVDMYMKAPVDSSGGRVTGKLSAPQVSWIKELEKSGNIERRFNWQFFTSGDSANPSLPVF